MIEELKKPYEDIKEKSENPDQPKRIYVDETGYATFYYVLQDKNPPIAPGTKIFIVGEMTQGKFVELQKDQHDPNGSYFAKLKIEPGHKYKFCFKVGDLIVTSAYYPSSINTYGYFLISKT